MMSPQKDKWDKWTTVRIPTELHRALQEVIAEEKDEFGLPKYRSTCVAVTEAVKQFLKKHKAKRENGG